MTDTNIGKWYDPIAERWIVPRAAPTMAVTTPDADRQLDFDRRTNAERIWNLLVDCCARG